MSRKLGKGRIEKEEEIDLDYLRSMRVRDDFLRILHSDNEAVADMFMLVHEEDPIETQIDELRLLLKRRGIFTVVTGGLHEETILRDKELGDMNEWMRQLSKKPEQKIKTRDDLEVSKTSSSMKLKNEEATKDDQEKESKKKENLGLKLELSNREINTRDSYQFEKNSKSPQTRDVEIKEGSAEKTGILKSSIPWGDREDSESDDEDLYEKDDLDELMKSTVVDGKEEIKGSGESDLEEKKSKMLTIEDEEGVRKTFRMYSLSDIREEKELTDNLNIVKKLKEKLDKYSTLKADPEVDFEGKLKRNFKKIFGNWDNEPLENGIRNLESQPYNLPRCEEVFSSNITYTTGHLKIVLNKEVFLKGKKDSKERKKKGRKIIGKFAIFTKYMNGALHETAFRYLFTSESDKNLFDIFPYAGLPNRVTPDYVHFDEERKELSVLEFATRKTDRERVLAAAFNEKEKYIAPLLKIKASIPEIKIIYGRLILSENTVLCPYVLDSACLKSLSCAYRAGLTVEVKISTLSDLEILNPKESAAADSLKKLVRANISKLEQWKTVELESEEKKVKREEMRTATIDEIMTRGRKGFISKNMFNQWMEAERSVDEQVSNDIYSKAAIEAVKKLHKDNNETSEDLCKKNTAEMKEEWGTLKAGISFKREPKTFQVLGLIPKLDREDAESLEEANLGEEISKFIKDREESKKEELKKEIFSREEDVELAVARMIVQVSKDEKTGKEEKETKKGKIKEMIGELTKFKGTLEEYNDRINEVIILRAIRRSNGKMKVQLDKMNKKEKTDLAARLSKKTEEEDKKYALKGGMEMNIMMMKAIAEEDEIKRRGLVNDRQTVINRIREEEKKRKLTKMLSDKEIGEKKKELLSSDGDLLKMLREDGKDLHLEITESNLNKLGADAKDALASILAKDESKRDYEDSMELLKLRSKLNDEIDDEKRELIREEYIEKENKMLSEKNTLTYSLNESEIHKIRSKENRARVSLSFRDQLALATKGWQGKKFKEKLSDRRLMMKSVVPLVDEDGEETLGQKMVKDFVENKANWLRLNKSAGWDVLDTAAGELYRSSLRVHGDFSTVDFSEELVRTRIGCCLNLWAQIMHEVCISFSTFLNKHEVVFKQAIPGVKLLMRSNGPIKNSNVIFIVDKRVHEDAGLPFKRPMIETENYLVYGILAINRHQFSHFANCESMMSLLTMWREGLNKTIDLRVIKKYTEEKDFEKKKDWVTKLFDETTIEHFLFSLSVFLTADQATSNTALQLRHFYMECMKGNGTRINPLKVKTKVGLHPRTEVHAFILRNMMKAAEMMSLNKPEPLISTTDDKLEINTGSTPESSENVINRDSFKNLISVVNLKPVPNFSFVLLISYVGSLHNKDKGEETPGFMKLFKKIIEQELNFEEAREEYCGWSTNKEGDFRNHEFSPEWMRTIGTFMKTKIKEKLGNITNDEYDVWIMKEMRKKIIDLNSSTLATMKVSADFDKLIEWQIKANTAVGLKYDWASVTLSQEVRKDMNEIFNQRIKVVEAISRLMMKKDDFVFPLLNIESLIEQQIEQGGVLVNLFKKQQLGGVREIFVLDIVSRLSILFLETWARIHCEHLENEMLTKGDKKFNKTREHFAEVHEYCSKQKDFVYRTSHDSGDSATWCQRFIMTCFGSFLSAVSSKGFLASFMEILNCVANKKLEMAKQMLNQFKKYSNDKSKESLTEEEINILKREFIGEDDALRLLFVSDGMFLRNETNMMQGILHYLSSLIHASHQMYVFDREKKLLVDLERNFRAKTGYTSVRFELINTGRISSDDFSNTRTIIATKIKGLNKNILIRTMSEWLKILSYTYIETYKHFCAKVSLEKSLICCMNGVVEFNSIWEIWNTTASIPIKFIYAATRMDPVTTMIGRQETLANLLKQTVENGLYLFTASLLQDFHARIHYSLLGCLVMRDYFEEYAEILLKLKHPALGYFCTQPPLAAGLLGFDFSHYILLTSFRESLLCERILLGNSDPETNESGTPTVSVYLTFGDLRKYGKFKDSIRKLGVLSEDWRDHGNKFPLSNVNPPENVEDAKFQICKKIMTGSISESFSFKSPARIYASAVYILVTRCVTTKMSYHENLSKKPMMPLLTLCQLILNELPRESTKADEEILEDKHLNASELKSLEEKGYRSNFKSQLKVLNRDSLRKFSIKSENTLNYLFNCRGFYDMIISNLNEISLNIYKNFTCMTKKLANKMGSIEIPLSVIPTAVSLVECVSFIWFGRGRYSHFAIRNAWSVYKTIFEWLDEDPETSMINGRFRDIVTMMDYISRQTARKKKIKFIAPFSIKKSPVLMLETMVNFHFVPSATIEPKKSAKALLGELELLDARLSNILMAPALLIREKTVLIERLLMGSKDFLEGSSIEGKMMILSLMNHQTAELAMMIHAMKSGTFSESMKTLMLLLKNFVVSFYIERQEMKREGEIMKYVGPGLIEIRLDNENFTKVKVLDDKVVEMAILESSDLSREKGLDIIIRELKRMGFKTEKGKPSFGSKWLIFKTGKIVSESVMEGCSVKILSKERLSSSYDQIGELKLSIDDELNKKAIRLIEKKTSSTIFRHAINYKLVSSVRGNIYLDVAEIYGDKTKKTEEDLTKDPLNLIFESWCNNEDIDAADWDSVSEVLEKLENVTSEIPDYMIMVENDKRTPKRKRRPGAERANWRNVFLDDDEEREAAEEGDFLMFDKKFLDTNFSKVSMNATLTAKAWKKSTLKLKNDVKSLIFERLNSARKNTINVSDIKTSISKGQDKLIELAESITELKLEDEFNLGDMDFGITEDEIKEIHDTKTTTDESSLDPDLDEKTKIGVAEDSKFDVLINLSNLDDPLEGMDLMASKEADDISKLFSTQVKLTELTKDSSLRREAIEIYMNRQNDSLKSITEIFRLCKVNKANFGLYSKAFQNIDFDERDLWTSALKWLGIELLNHEDYLEKLIESRMIGRSELEFYKKKVGVGAKTETQKKRAKSSKSVGRK